MSTPVISVQGLGKRYYLSHHERHDTLRGQLTQIGKGLFKRPSPVEQEEFWALRDVSFDVERGDVIGIVGRNGAGKSTLLKILSRITEPTKGRATIRGRVASLLEVGTGFHPELSGRDNIFLNGAILGMSRTEIVRKFDEIVAFAEVERFLDTQVKHYSSGMYVRLAFSVAAHLEPEILIIDEVLAVGDAQFQKKCLGKMRDVTQGDGRTVLFVSHNSAALQSICNKGVWLQQGQVAGQGPIRECLAAYLRSGSQQVEFTARNDQPRISAVRIDQTALTEGCLQVEVGFTSPFAFTPMIGIVMYNKYGQPVLGSNGRMAGESWRPGSRQTGTVTARIAHLPLHSDTYRLSVWLGDTSMDYDERRDIVEFEFVAKKFHPQAPSVEVIGPVDVPWTWSVAGD